MARKSRKRKRSSLIEHENLNKKETKSSETKYRKRRSRDKAVKSKDKSDVVRVRVKRIKLKNSKRRASVIYSEECDSLNVSTVLFSDEEDTDVPKSVWTPTPRGGTEYSDVFSSPYNKSSKEKHLSQLYKPIARPAGPPRPVIVDGVNVCFGHGLKKKFSAMGIALMWRFFALRNHEVRILMPARWKQECVQFDDLEQNGTLRYFIPINSRNSHYVQYIRHLIGKAAELGGVVISRDTFNELLKDKNLSFVLRETINNRVLQYTFVDDMLLFPDDPMGRHGPTLEEFLTFPPYNCYQNLRRLI